MAPMTHETDEDSIMTLDCRHNLIQRSVDDCWRCVYCGERFVPAAANGCLG